MMKKLEIQCPYCSVENTLTVFQAGKDTLFKVKCAACAREFQIDSEGSILHLGKDQERTYRDDRLEVMRTQYPSMPDTGSLTPKERKEVQKLIDEIEESEREFEEETKADIQMGIPREGVPQPAPHDPKKQGTVSPSDDNPRIVPMKKIGSPSTDAGADEKPRVVPIEKTKGPQPEIGAKDKPHIVPITKDKNQTPEVDAKDESRSIPNKKEDVSPPIGGEKATIPGKEKKSDGQRNKEVTSAKDDASPQPETPVARPMEMPMYPYPPFPPGQIPPHYPPGPQHYQYPPGTPPGTYPPLQGSTSIPTDPSPGSVSSNAIPLSLSLSGAEDPIPEES